MYDQTTYHIEAEIGDNEPTDDDNNQDINKELENAICILWQSYPMLDHQKQWANPHHNCPLLTPLIVDNPKYTSLRIGKLMQMKAYMHPWEYTAKVVDHVQDSGGSNVRGSGWGNHPKRHIHKQEDHPQCDEPLHVDCNHSQHGPNQPHHGGGGDGGDGGGAINTLLTPYTSGKVTFSIEKVSSTKKVTTSPTSAETTIPSLMP
ncbi:hypothetical protein BDQ12DRAFT_669802 [Crucibulum laeve]|uniref:Uncharacterized protein n=1 Tax=Crucibulum laeve TaxID=68775 RepID=A0A5C3LNT3_9AGAR|nr:hypothetical protein BDQ12DRAFT_669802 [Crucibulum laeve]